MIGFGTGRLVHRITRPHISTYLFVEYPAMKLDRITVNPKRMNGQPCIRELRLTVRRVLEILAIYPDRAELWREYPELEEEDIRQALAYAAASLEDRIVDFPYEAAA
jgi:uncharacterized protein (DUF433 family)